VTSKQKWAARAAVVGLSASALIGVSTSSSSALGSTCTPPGSRPSGPVTTLLRPIIGDAGYNNGPFGLGDEPFFITGTLDALVCPLLP
jgi:hypothetical protein